MSFDLFFCTRVGGRIDFDSVERWSQELKHFSRTGPGQLWYENPNTGVYFVLDYEPEAPEDPDDCPIPVGWVDSGLSLNLNFNRPSFFAYEAMPLAAQLSTDLSLHVLNPQVDDEVPIPPSIISAHELLQSWKRSNEKAVVSLAGLEEPTVNPYLAEHKATYVWNYSRLKNTLEDICGEELFVPRLFVARRGSRSQLLVGFVCTEDVPTIIPQSDVVFVVRNKKGFLRKKKAEVGVITRAEFDVLAGQFTQTFPWEGPPVSVIRPAGAEILAKLLRSLELPLNRGEYQQVAMDSFVDVELPREG